MLISFRAVPVSLQPQDLLEGLDVDAQDRSRPLEVVAAQSEDTLRVVMLGAVEGCGFFQCLGVEGRNFGAAAMKALVLREAVRSPPLGNMRRAGEMLEDSLGEMARLLVATKAPIGVEHGKERAPAALEPAMIEPV